MNLLFILYLLLLVSHVDGTDYDLTQILDEYSHLNRNGSEIIRAGNERLATMKKESTCEAMVANEILTNCDEITKKMKIDLTNKYVRCRAESEGAELHYECKGWTSYLGMPCEKAPVIEKNTDWWITHEIFYHDIEKMCFAHMFESWKQRSLQEYARLRKMDHKITDGFFTLVDEINDIRVKHAGYFESIEDGIRNSVAIMSSMAQDLRALHDKTEIVTRKLDSVSGNIDKISDDTSLVSDRTGEAAAMLETVLSMVNELQNPIREVIEFANGSHPHIPYIGNVFIAMRRMMSTLSPLFHMVGYPIAFVVSCSVVLVWWWYLRSPLVLIPSILFMCTLDMFLLEDLWRAPTYVTIAGGVGLVLASAARCGGFIV